MTVRRPSPWQIRPQRRGAVLLAALICLIVIAILAAGLLRLCLNQRGRLETDARRLQAEWLAESGLDRAAARLAASGSYTGETWNIAADELGGRWPGRVQITVEPVDGHPTQRRVTAQAAYPREATLQARQTKHATVELNSESSGERS